MVARADHYGIFGKHTGTKEQGENSTIRVCTYQLVNLRLPAEKRKLVKLFARPLQGRVTFQ
jgi:hypothetical protein